MPVAVAAALLQHTGAAVLTNPLLVPPPWCDPCDLCSVAVRWKGPVFTLPWQWPWRAPVRRTLVRGNTRSHTAAEAGDRYSIIRRVTREAAESHCSELAAETRGKLERGWEWGGGCLSARVTEKGCVCMSWRWCICHWTVLTCSEVLKDLWKSIFFKLKLETWILYQKHIFLHNWSYFCLILAGPTYRVVLVHYSGLLPTTSPLWHPMQIQSEVHCATLGGISSSKSCSDSYLVWVVG